MSSILDAETILMENEYWTRLEEEWGIPVDLEVDTEEDHRLKKVFSSLDLKGATFDSSLLLKKVRRKVSRKVSKKSTPSILDYKDFIGDLKKDSNMESSNNFYIVNGQILSAVSVEKICKEIDDVFKSIEKLSSATSTLRKIPKVPEIVQCSISIDDLSFDDTKKSVTEEYKSSIEEYKSYIEEFNSDFDRNIEEALDQFSATISSIDRVEQSTLDSVTTLVRKFSSVLSSPVMSYSWTPKKRQCCDKFQELIEFWNNRAFEAN